MQRITVFFWGILGGFAWLAISAFLISANEALGGAWVAAALAFEGFVVFAAGANAVIARQKRQKRERRPASRPRLSAWEPPTEASGGASGTAASGSTGGRVVLSARLK